MTGHSLAAPLPGLSASRGNAVIAVRDLTKRFEQVEAVRGVTFDVAPGETFGFLGPNGAGKSTTISILCTLVRPTSGHASVAGFDVVAEPLRVRSRIGLVFQDTTLDDYLTAAENLRFHAELYGVRRAEVGPRIDEVLEMVGLADRRTSLVRTFSGGMKRRLEIARGLLHSPRVLFLDEPTVGLDPQTRSHIWSYINELRTRESITVFLTTHYMDEAEHCDRIAIIDHGELVAERLAPTRSRRRSARTGSSCRSTTGRRDRRRSRWASGSRRTRARVPSPSTSPAVTSSCLGCSPGSRCRSARSASRARPWTTSS